MSVTASFLTNAKFSVTSHKAHRVQEKSGLITGKVSQNVSPALPPAGKPTPSASCSLQGKAAAGDPPSRPSY